MKLIIVTFLIMGFGFYELSGGSDFEPADWRNAKAPDVAVAPLDESKSTSIADTLLDLVAPEKPVPAAADENTPTHYEMAVLTSPPTVRRLAGVAKPTPLSERAELGLNDVAGPSEKAPRVSAALPVIPMVSEPDFRLVSGNRVNMRNGPGTQYSVVGKLLRDSEVEVLQDPGQGWVKLQALESGRVGWMSANLLTKITY